MNRKTPAIDVSAMPIAPLDAFRPASEQIFTTLRAAILATQLPPGRMISETEVGQLFGASRTPVREAFTLLRDEGLLIALPSRGTYVSKLSEIEIRGAQFLREALEVAIVERLCNEGLSNKHEDELRLNLDQQAEAVADCDKSRFPSLDDEFHDILARATGFDRASSLLAREKTILDRLRVLSLNDQDQMARLLEEHTGIFLAVRAGYVGQAADRMRRHLRVILETLSGMIAENQDFFD